MFMVINIKRRAGPIDTGLKNPPHITTHCRVTWNCIWLSFDCSVLLVAWWANCNIYHNANTIKLVHNIYKKHRVNGHATQALHFFLSRNDIIKLTSWNLNIKFSPVRHWPSTPLEWLSITRELDLDLDFGSGHTAYGRASLIDLCVHTKLHWNRKNYFVDGLTAGTAPSSRSRDTKTRKNIENPARRNLDIVL